METKMITKPASTGAPCCRRREGCGSPVSFSVPHATTVMVTRERCLLSRSALAAAIAATVALVLIIIHHPGNDGSLFVYSFVMPQQPSAFRRQSNVVASPLSSLLHSPKASEKRRWRTSMSASTIKEAQAVGSANEGATLANGDFSASSAPAPLTVLNGDITASTSLDSDAVVNGVATNTNGAVANVPKTEADFSEDMADVPLPTEAGGYSHTKASKAKISAANKGKVPWNKGKGRSEEVKRRIAEGVRKRNRERFLAKLADMGVTEEEYEQKKKEERRKKDAERRARRTEKGGYRPTEETKAKISAVLKEKWARGEVKKRKPNGGARKKGFKHSDETKQKIRESLKKRWATDPEYRAKKVSSAKKQNSSDDARKKIAETLRKKWEDPEFRAYMMERMATRKKANVIVDEEHKKKISMAMKRKWQDKDYRAKAVEGMRKHMEANPRSQRPASARRRKIAQKAESPGRVQVGDGSLFAVTPQRKRSPRTKAMRRDANGVGGTTVKRKKRKKKAAKDSSGSGTSLEAMEPLMKPKAQPGEAAKKESIDMSDGSLDRLRLERRDLYDLLYGDEGETHFATESALYNKEKFDPKETKGAPVSAHSSESSVWAEDDEMDDENLDNFDPYGLDDF
uniref:Nuclease associated modular domain-containing protein n=1 Tax=Odontella aurita TaxID=265563 RepID=A0A6U6K8I3_9STRA|mmetsp:Transcript_60649/g.179847  ORF Transcript_60649/g.179847 Transcript_60649/m.179847 type:complete len:629 (+) Transcript_60649:298-2184(+)